MKMKTVDNHNAISSSGCVDSISKPLFDSTQIVAFNYVKEDFNGKRLSLSNHPDWLMNHFDKCYYNNNIEKYMAVYLYDYVFIDGLPMDDMIRDAKENFSLYNGFTLHRVNTDGFEFFHFCTGSDNPEMSNWYLNNIPLLKKFILYFLENAKETIHIVKPYVPCVPVASQKEKYLELLEQGRREASLLNQLSVKSWSCKIKDKTIKLNKREIEVITRLLTGKTAKEIAKELFLSPRTIEYYLNNAKKKFACHTKSELLKIMANTNFIQDFGV